MKLSCLRIGSRGGKQQQRASFSQKGRWKTRGLRDTIEQPQLSLSTAVVLIDVMTSALKRSNCGKCDRLSYFFFLLLTCNLLETGVPLSITPAPVETPHCNQLSYLHPPTALSLLSSGLIPAERPPFHTFTPFPFITLTLARLVALGTPGQDASLRWTHTFTPYCTSPWKTWKVAPTCD